MGEHDTGNRAVVGLAMFAEDIGRGDAAVVLANVGQWPDPCDVSNRPDIVGRAHAPVDGYTARSRFDTDVLEPQIRDPRSSAGGDEQPIGAKRAAVLELHDVAGAVVRHMTRAPTEMDLQALALKRFGERFAERTWLPRQEWAHPLHGPQPRPELPEPLPHPDATGPPAAPQDPARH